MRSLVLAVFATIILLVVGNVNVATEVDGSTNVASASSIPNVVAPPPETVVDFIKKKNLGGLKSYLESGGNVNLFGGQSLLILAAVARFSEGIRLLTVAGANPDVLEADGWSPILFSTVFGDIESVNALMSVKANQFIISKNLKKNAYDLAIQTNNLPVSY